MNREHSKAHDPHDLLDTDTHRRNIARARECLADNLDLIRAVIRQTARLRCVCGDERDEFEQYVMLKLLDNELAILRKFRGDSALKTFLTVVVQRLLLDFRNHRWGRWRPSAQARRLGRHAMQLERMVVRDGRTVTEAIAVLRARPSTAEEEAALEAAATRLSLQPRRRLVSDAGLDVIPSPDTADQGVAMRERRRWILRVRAALVAAMLTLPEEDRFLVRLRYLERWTVPQIARLFEVPTKPLYRHFDRQLKLLRAQMTARGVAWANVTDLMGRAETDLQLGAAR